MADITRLILDDHEWFRAQFAALDDLQARDATPEELRTVWDPLAAHLDLHAIAEEKIFYPQLLKRGENPEDETLDAIGDHNDIRDGVHDADRHPVGGDAWWQAVGRARVANDDHMAEEEREGLSDFRLNATIGLRESLGTLFSGTSPRTAAPAASTRRTRTPRSTYARSRSRSPPTRPTRSPPRTVRSASAA